MPASDKDKLLHRVAQDHGATVQMELHRRFRSQPASTGDGRPRRTVAELLDAAAETRRERERQAEAAQAAQQARRARERAQLRQL